MNEGFTDYLLATADNWPPAAARLLLLSLMVGLFWHVQNRLTKFDDGDELYVKGNVAYLLHRYGLVLGFIVGSLPSVSRVYDDNPWVGLTGQFLEHLWVFVALLLVRVVVDKIVLFRLNNLDELLAGNHAVGWVEAGFYIGFGFILNGSLTGASPSPAIGFATTVVFAALGLLFMIGVFAFHELITPWHLNGNIRDGNVTAALEVAGVLAATGIVVREGVAGDFTGWTEGFIAFSATALFAVGTLYLFRFIIDRAILLNCTVRTIQANDQMVASALMSGMFVAIAFPIAAIVRTHL